MSSIVAVLVASLLAFASTNVDDLFLLLLFFGQGVRVRTVVLGQVLGFAAIVLVSLAVSEGALLLQPAWVGLLGVAPLAIGLKGLFALRKRSAGEAVPDARRLGVLSVAAVTLANGGDNIAVYAPLFARRPWPELTVILAVFGVMLAALCATALGLVRRPAISSVLRARARAAAPIVLIALGVYIFVDAGTPSYVRGLLSSRREVPVSPPAPPTSHPAPVAADAAPEAADAAPEAQATLPDGPTVVWTRREIPRKGDLPRTVDTSYFLDENGNETSKRRGIFLLMGERVLEVKIAARKTAGLKCEGDRPNPLYPHRIEVRVSLIAAGGAEPIVLADYGSLSDGDHQVDVEEQELVGAIGPYVFLFSSWQLGGCMGIHPLYGAAFSTFEIRGQDAHTVSLDAVTEGWSEVRARAKELFDAKATDQTGSTLDGPAELEGIEPTLGLPSFGKDELGWELQLTTSASWAGTYGHWAGYTRSVRVRARQVPDIFARYAPLAPLAARLAARHPGETVVGVTRGGM